MNERPPAHPDPGVFCVMTEDSKCVGVCHQQAELPLGTRKLHKIMFRVQFPSLSHHYKIFNLFSL